MECIILAGGLGTRLRSVVSNRPKALAQIENKPFLSYVIDNLNSYGVTKYIFSLNYLHQQIENFLKENYDKLNYECVVESELLGTGGAIANALKYCKNSNILIVNADTFLELDLVNMINFHNNNNASCTIALKKMVNYDRYGSVLFDTKMKITAFIEKEPTKEGYINAGYILIKKDLFKNFNKYKFSLENDFLHKNLNNVDIFGFITEGYFIDIGIPEDYQNFKIKHNKIH